MLTEYEAHKLQRDIRRRWNATSGVVPKDAALLLIIMVLLLVGSGN